MIAADGSPEITTGPVWNETQARLHQMLCLAKDICIECSSPTERDSGQVIALEDDSKAFGIRLALNHSVSCHTCGKVFSVTRGLN